jgi:hypothetical protein
VIDMVLADEAAAIAVACEACSGLRRLEQQIRWSNVKADALAEVRVDAGRPGGVSRLLLVRSTPVNRRIVAAHADLIASAYPARHDDALAALRGVAPWPGSALVWCSVGNGDARLLDSPPRQASRGCRT